MHGLHGSYMAGLESNSFRCHCVGSGWEDSGLFDPRWYWELLYKHYTSLRVNDTHANMWSCGWTNYQVCVQYNTVLFQCLLITNMASELSKLVHLKNYCQSLMCSFCCVRMHVTNGGQNIKQQQSKMWAAFSVIIEGVPIKSGLLYVYVKQLSGVG